MKVKVTLEAVVESSDISQAAQTIQNAVINAVQNSHSTFISWVQPLRVVRLEAKLEEETR